MNLRILKKLSKRAAPLLAALGDNRPQFPAVPHDNYHGTAGFDRKHWDRTHCHPSYQAHGSEIVYVTRSGRHMVMREPWHPRRGTIMVGAMSGYYEPEWDEETAWDSLRNFVAAHFTDWSEPEPVPTRKFRTPRDYLRAAADMLAGAA